MKCCAPSEQQYRSRSIPFRASFLLTDSYISIITGGEELRVSGALAEGETLIVDSALVTARW